MSQHDNSEINSAIETNNGQCSCCSPANILEVWLDRYFSSDQEHTLQSPLSLSFGGHLGVGHSGSELDPFK